MDHPGKCRLAEVVVKDDHAQLDMSIPFYRSYWLTALFEPGDFLIAIMYMAALDQGVSFHELGMECQFSGIRSGQ